MVSSLCCKGEGPQRKGGIPDPSPGRLSGSLSGKWKGRGRGSLRKRERQKERVTQSVREAGAIPLLVTAGQSRSLARSLSPWITCCRVAGCDSATLRRLCDAGVWANGVDIPLNQPETGSDRDSLRLRACGSETLRSLSCQADRQCQRTGSGFFAVPSTLNPP